MENNKEIVFTPEQVKKLWAYQFGPWTNPFDMEKIDLKDYNPRMHPFTCGNNGLYCDELVPTIYGWICPYCDYTQKWAHGFMKG